MGSPAPARSLVDGRGKCRSGGGELAMFDGDSLCGAAFRYARWLRETGQWDAMYHFTAVIHPAVGRLAGRFRTRVADLTPAVVAWSYREAARPRITRDEVLVAWAGFGDFLGRMELGTMPPLPATIVIKTERQVGQNDRNSGRSRLNEERNSVI